MWLGQFTPSQTNTLAFWFATENRWLRGQIMTIHRRLVDALNSEHDQVLLVEQASPYDLRFRTRRAPAVRAGIAVPNILYCVPIEDEVTPAAPRDEHAWVLKTPERVELGLGPFEINGRLHLPEGAALEDTLGMLQRRFLAVTDVVVRRVDGLASTQRYPVVVVNGRCIEYVMPESEESAADNPSSGHFGELALGGVNR